MAERPSPWKLGFIAAHTEHVCMQETWFTSERTDIIDTTNMQLAMLGSSEVDPVSVTGHPKNNGFIEDFAAGLTDEKVIATSVTLLATGNPKAALVVLVVGGVAAATVGDEFGAGANGEDNGLLLMSQGDAIRELVGEFSADVCAGEDCLEDKGFNWARVRPVESSATEGSEFVDLFCTHLQNTGTAVSFGDAHAARNEQLGLLKAAIDNLAAADRRPILVGDTNFNANDEGTYRTFRETLGLTELAAFENHNTLLSDRYDLGVRDGATTTDQDIDDFFNVGPGVPIFTGFGTSLGRNQPCHEVDPTEDRIDYVLILPSSDERPNFGVVEESFEIFPFFPGASMNVDDPDDPKRAPEDGDSLGGGVMVPSYEGVATHDGRCLSDHAAVVANIGLVRLRHDTVLNPFRDHRFEFHVSKIQTNSGDCFGCGDPDMAGTLSHSADGETLSEQGFGPVDDSKVINDAAAASWCQPALATNSSPAVQTLELEVDEEDSFDTDDFDVSPVSDEDNVFYQFVDGQELFLSETGGALRKPQCDFMATTATNHCSWDERGDSNDSEKATVTYALSFEDVGDACPDP